ncbi:MAG: arginyltransferase [Planctomycetota bacterium]|nr:MAG: arginyltransferase [Planctomycetota bacterium]REK38886.1 MAG: arginyltransferase [Planctomycetota bacterium]
MKDVSLDFLSPSITEPQRPCSYLPEETASLVYRISAGMSETALGEMLRRGWRRHGCHLFRPACPRCTKCRSLRVDVARFTPTKSQRRCRKRNADVNVFIRRPTVTIDHVRLYNAWHEDMTERRGWRPSHTTIDDYADSFLAGQWESAREMLYLRNNRLVGVGLIDLVPDGLSSIYFYHDPAWRPLGPGTFSALHEIDLCRRTGRAFCYLGYCIAGCPSMSYKARFRPHQILSRYVDDDEAPEWITEQETPLRK